MSETIADEWSGESPFDLSAVFYDIDYRDRPDLAFWLKYGPGWGPSILELACGSGRVLSALKEGAGEGRLELAGIDVSRAMVERARRRTGLETIRQGDMRSFASVAPGPYDCVIVPFNSLMHLENAPDWRRTFDQVRTVLRRGGVFAFSVLNPASETWEDEAWWEVDERTVFVSPDGTVAEGPEGGGRCVRYRKWCRKRIVPDRTGLVQLSFAFLPDGESPGAEKEEDGLGPDGLVRVRFTFPLRYVFPSEVMTLLSDAGFVLEHLWADWTERPPTDESEHMIFVARAF